MWEIGPSAPKTASNGIKLDQNAAFTIPPLKVKIIVLGFLFIVKVSWQHTPLKYDYFSSRFRSVPVLKYTESE